MLTSASSDAPDASGMDGEAQRQCDYLVARQYVYVAQANNEMKASLTARVH